MPANIGGVALDISGVEFHVRRCTVCEFLYKDPVISFDALMECYRRIPETFYGFEVDSRRRRFDDIGATLAQHAPGRRILDVGCFNGAFLKSLGDSWDRYGVDPCGPATDVAKQRGATILGETIDDVDPAQKFDAIVAIDVAEHIVDPLGFFQQVRDRLKPRGIAMFVTGDSQAPLWKWQRSLYWYVIIPEHVGFYSEPTMRWIAKKLGMETIEHIRRSHQRDTLTNKGLQTAKNVGYMATRAVGGLGIASIRKSVFSRGAPGWTMSKDHMYHVMRRVD